jgi:hypothetical protein
MGFVFFQSGIAKIAALNAFGVSLSNRGVPFSNF